MTSKKQKVVYKSFEEFRSELFPNLVNRETTEETKRDSEQFGITLADKVLDELTNIKSVPKTL